VLRGDGPNACLIAKGMIQSLPRMREQSAVLHAGMTTAIGMRRLCATAVLMLEVGSAFRGTSMSVKMRMHMHMVVLGSDMSVTQKTMGSAAHDEA